MKPIPNFDDYFADELGSIFSTLPLRNSRKPPTEPRLLKPSKDGDGYLYVGLMKNGKRFIRKVHRLILETFVGECPDGMETCHNDGTRTNNRLENLRWDTRKNNHADKIKHGTWQGGERCWKSKLNELQVRVIRRCAELGMLQREIAEVFHGSRRNISLIIRRERWAYL